MAAKNWSAAAPTACSRIRPTCCSTSTRSADGVDSVGSAQRDRQVLAELLDEVAADACVDAALPVVEHHRGRERQGRGVPDAGVEIEPAGAVAIEADELVRR